MRLVFIPEFDYDAEMIQSQLAQKNRGDIFVFTCDGYIPQEGDVVEYNVSPDKENGLLLDFAQNISRFGCIDEMQLKDKRPSDGEEGVPPMKECPECANILHAAMRACPCGYEFPENEIKIQKQADNQAVLSTQKVHETKVVQSVNYHLHAKAGKTPSMKVEYVISPLETYCEWICFEHTGFARRKAETWWKENTDGNRAKGMQQAIKYLEGIPNKVQTALELSNTIKVPAAIQVYKDGKYWVIANRSNEELIEADPTPIESHPHELDDFDDPPF